MVATDIKPLETHWNGWLFRSRLEARWAVFLHTLGLAFEYEPEGYDLGEAGWYLPDFYLPESGLWLEIKPDAELRPEDAAKGIAFDDKITARNRAKWLIDASAPSWEYRILAGQPWYGEYGPFYQVLAVGIKSIHAIDEVWTECPLCHTFAIRMTPWTSYYAEEYLLCYHCDCVDRNWRETANTHFHKGTVETTLMGYAVSSPRMMEAYGAARSARFEKGR